MTKKEYTQPALEVYGSIENLTKSTGSVTASDSLNLTGLPGGDLTVPNSGSVDATLDV